MNCREFRKRWDELLDARSAPAVDLERVLESHASACTRCGILSARYQLLRQAISSLRPPSPSAASIERLSRLKVPSDSPTIPTGRRPRHLAPMAAAAAAFALAWLGGGWWPSREPGGVSSPDLASRAAPHRALGDALAEATDATIDLAREASIPASRIGRGMLDLGRLTASGLDLPKNPFEAAGLSVEPDPSATDLFKAVGQRVGAGVRPLSGSARHAFSFLLGPLDDPAPPDLRQRNSL